MSDEQTTARGTSPSRDLSHSPGAGERFGTSGAPGAPFPARDGRRQVGAVGPREDVFGLVISVLLFGYFGFLQGLSTTTTPGGPVVPMFAVFVWTLRIAAVGFLMALALQLLRRGRLAVLVAGVVGLLSAVAFLVLGVWDLMDDSLALALSPLFLLLFAAWNGYVSWGSLSTLRRGGESAF